MSNIFKIQCSVQVDTMDPSLSNSLAIDPLNATDSSLCVRCLSSLPCLTSVHSDCLPSCSLWCWHCSLAPDAICLSHSVDSSALSYTVRSPPSHRTLAHVQIWNVRVPSFPFVQFKFSVYGHTYACRQTDIHTHVLQCSPASVDLAQARPNNTFWAFPSSAQLPPPHCKTRLVALTTDCLPWLQISWGVSG